MIIFVTGIAGNDPRQSCRASVAPRSGSLLPLFLGRRGLGRGGRFKRTEWQVRGEGRGEGERTWMSRAGG